MDNNKECEWPMITYYNAATPQIAIPVTVKKPSPIHSILLKLGFREQQEKHNCGTKEKFTSIMLLILLVAFLIGLAGFFLMWFTELYNDSLLENLIYKEGSTAVKWFKQPPLNPHIKLHIFNYTNADRFIAGLDDKLIVKDLGPYTYVEQVERVNVTFHPNYTLSYQEYRTQEFVPELSQGTIIDQIVVPNIPFFAAVLKVMNMNYFVQFGARLAISNTESKPFITLNANDFFWGYDDRLIKLASVADFNNPVLYEKFGMFVNRKGLSKDVFTIYTGEDDIKKLGVINNFNGMSKLDLWGTDECNRVDGTDGSQFPPHFMDKKHELKIFVKSFCRKFPLIYDSEVNLFDGVPAWRYKAPLNVFSPPEEYSYNQCYCEKQTGSCPPKGVFNASSCFDGAPIYTSFPHFFTADPQLTKRIVGLDPSEKQHSTYADIHSRLAFPIDGASRFQVNVMVHNYSYFEELKHFDEHMILPVVWMEVLPGELSQDLKAMIYHSTFSINAIQLSLRYGSLLFCVTTLALLIIGCYYRGKSNATRALSNVCEIEVIPL